MNTLYCFLTFMLIAALCLVVLPFIKNKAIFSKSFFITFLFALLFSLGMYQFFGDKDALKQWYTQGEQHYQLQLQFNALGGIDGLITRVKKKIQANPLDTQGWFILGKLYLMKPDYPSARTALRKAHELDPHNEQINHYYEIAVTHSE